MAMSVNNIHPPLFKNKIHPCDNNSEYLGEENTTNNDHLNIAFMNTRGQTGLDLTKQAQIESFLKFHRIDILNCQETNVSEDTFSQNHFITSSYLTMPLINMALLVLFQIILLLKTSKWTQKVE